MAVTRAGRPLTGIVIARDPDGALLAEVAGRGVGRRKAQPDLVTLAEPRSGEPVAGVGDAVLIRFEDDPADDERRLGRVLKVLEPCGQRAVGVYRRDGGGLGGRVTPIDRRSAGRDIRIGRGDDHDAEPGELVVVLVDDDRGIGPRQGRVVERLGRQDSEAAASQLAILAHGLPDTFSEAALDEAKRARLPDLKGREDWRDLPLVTIDPADAKDHDDAVHAAADDDPANRGGFVLTVAIADVSAFVPVGGALDQEALRRGNSVYFPDRVVPMLPERLSADLCSLKPAVDRPALACRIVIDAEGRKLSHRFHRVMMRSAAKLAYEEAQAVLDDKTPASSGPVAPGLKALNGAYRALLTARARREPLDLELPERKLIIGKDGRLADVISPPRLDTHRLIEEFMVLANVCAAETLEAAKQPLIYRIHDEPPPEKIGALADVLKSLDMPVPRGQRLAPSLFNGVLAQVKGTEHQFLVNELVLRSQAQAEYASRNHGHFGLNLRRYAHFTSPIRRYADLVVHRALVHALKLDPMEDRAVVSAALTHAALAETAQSITRAERRAVAAERETADRLIAGAFQSKLGETFEGRIGGVTRGGLFVRLFSMAAEGFVPMDALGADHYVVSEDRRSIVGRRSGLAFRLGDTVSVQLDAADPLTGQLRFTMLSEGVPDRGGRLPRRGPASRSWRAGLDKKHRPAKAGRGKGKAGKGRASRGR